MLRRTITTPYKRWHQRLHRPNSLVIAHRQSDIVLIQCGSSNNHDKPKKKSDWIGGGMLVSPTFLVQQRRFTKTN